MSSVDVFYEHLYQVSRVDLGGVIFYEEGDFKKLDMAYTKRKLSLIGSLGGSSFEMIIPLEGQSIDYSINDKKFSLKPLDFKSFIVKVKSNLFDIVSPLLTTKGSNARLISINITNCGRGIKIITN